MILTLTIILIVASLVAIGLLVFESPSFKTIRRTSILHNSSVNHSASDNTENDLSDQIIDENRSNMSDEERETRNLIGDSKYEEMSHHVSQLLERHKKDSFRTVMLTGGSIERNALKTLHSLLPGDSVRLQDNSRNGIPDVGVYVGDERIGRLLLDDATGALEAMTGTLVTGAYVAEQNSYGDESNSISVKLIIFFTSAAIPDHQTTEPLKSPYKLIYRGLRPIVIYQN